MEKVLEYIGIILSLLGVLYFVIRFFYFGTKNSFESEIKKITKLEYFLLIKNTDIESGRKVSILLNLMLRTFYALFILAIIGLFIFVLSQTV